MRSLPFLLALPAAAQASEHGGFARIAAGPAWQRVDLQSGGDVYGGGAGRVAAFQAALGAHATESLVLHADFLQSVQDDPVLRVHGRIERGGGTLVWRAVGLGATWYPDEGGGFFELGLLFAKGRREFSGGASVASSLGLGWRALSGWEYLLAPPFGLGAAVEMQRSVLPGDGTTHETRHLTFAGLLFAVVHAR